MPAPVLAAAGRALVQRGTAATKKSATNKLQNAATSGSSEDQIAMVSGIALRYAWLTLIPTFGLTLIYIIIHFIGKYLASSAWFCPFGSEWAPKGVPIGSASSAVEYAEIIAFVILDILIFVSILGVLCILVWEFCGIVHDHWFLAWAASFKSEIVEGARQLCKNVNT